MKRLLVIGAVVVGSACGDRTATQYVGTAMNDAAPDAAAKFKLTLSSRTDTSFGGILELGPPATGTGSAYAWFDGPDFKIVSVAGTGGDTIVWTSKLTDEGLGGRFEITGGRRTGQQGTWRASLTKGPPATRATLRRPQTPAPPPLSATWTLVLFALSAWWLARWIRRTPPPADVTGPLAIGAPLTREIQSGVAGWLAFFVITQVLGLIYSFVRLSDVRTEYVTGMGVGAAVTGMQPLIVLETASQLVAPVIAFAGIVMVVRHSRYAPRYWFGYLVASVVFVVVDAVMAVPLHAELRRLLGAAYSESLARADAVTRNEMRQVAASVLWALYWARSERVRATFGLAALDRTSRPISPAADFPTLQEDQRPSTRRRRWRAALRTAGAILVGLIALVGVGMWQARVQPYSVPAGTDIRKTVAGQWTWTTDKQRCANAHTVAFSDDGKVMTIVQPSHSIDAPDASTTTYDILQVTRSSIRGAIRGEKRLDDAGKPVVWDLVLVSPDEYRWRRADWSTPWGYTPSIVRCPPPKTAKRAVP